MLMFWCKLNKSCNNSNNNNNNNFDLQIHNEEIHDLLNPCPSDESRIAIRDTHDGGIKVIKLKAIIIDNNNYLRHNVRDV